MEAPIQQKPFEEAIEKLIVKLRRAELPEHVFNLYRETHPELDLRGAAAKRRENLRRYLKAIRDPRYAFIGIAPGWRGARFTGVPFTDEDRLCLPGSCYDRTSSRQRPYREATAGVVMDVLGARTDIICFNIVPWHCHAPGNPLSNADPDSEVISYGREVLEFLFARLYPNVQAVAVGQLAARELAALRINGKAVPVAAELHHPSHGGANDFRAGTIELLGASDDE